MKEIMNKVGNWFGTLICIAVLLLSVNEVNNVIKTGETTNTFFGDTINSVATITTDILEDHGYVQVDGQLCKVVDVEHEYTVFNHDVSFTTQNVIEINNVKDFINYWNK